MADITEVLNFGQGPEHSRGSFLVLHLLIPAVFYPNKNVLVGKHLHLLEGIQNQTFNCDMLE